APLVPPPQLLQARRRRLPGAEGPDGARAPPAAKDRCPAPPGKGPGSRMSAGAVALDVATMREQGFVVVPDLVPPAELDAMRRALAPHLGARLLGRNDFEGHRTQRVYSLVGVAPIFADLIEHPHVLGICDAFLEPNYLLTASQAIDILPGE